jgi:uncharacterized metal-binding protein
MVESISINKSIASIMSENDGKVTVVTLSQSPDLDINHFGFKRFDVLHGAQWPPDSKNETQSSLKCGFLGSVSLLCILSRCMFKRRIVSRVFSGQQAKGRRDP